MIIILLTVVIFIFAVSGLALGVMFGRSPIKGSCGGCADCICRKKPS